MTSHDVEADPFRILDNRLTVLGQKIEALQGLSVKHGNEHVYLIIAVTLDLVITVGQVLLVLAVLS